MFGRRKVAALVAEFLGTGVLTLVFLGVERSTIGVPYFVAIAAGLVMTMVALIFSDASGAHVNPAVTIALWTARKVGSLTALLYVVLQVLGAWTAYGVYTYFVNSSLQKIGGTYSGRILVAEAIGTFVLALGWAAVAFRNYTAGTRASLLGVAYTLGVIVAAAAGIGIVNPAVAMGIRAWEVFGSMGWGTYVLGPVLGAVIGVNLYGLLFAGSTAAGDAVVLEEVVVAETVEAPATKRTTTRRTTARKNSTRAKSSTRRTSTRSRA